MRGAVVRRETIAVEVPEAESQRILNREITEEVSRDTKPLTSEEFEDFQMVYQAEQIQQGSQEKPEMVLQGNSERAEELLERYAEEREKMYEKSVSARFEFVKALPRPVTKALTFAGIETDGQALAAFLELVPWVGTLYAVAGKRVKSVGRGGVEFEDMTGIDRILYAIGDWSPVPFSQTVAGAIVKSEAFQAKIGEYGRKARGAVRAFKNEPLAIFRSEKSAV
jgi:hypothetical protein